MELEIGLLRGDTSDPACTALPERFHRKFTAPAPRHPDGGAYTRRCSILVTPPSFESYWATPASYWLRQRVRRAVKEGYSVGAIDRDQHLDDIFEINTSLEQRQGRAMSEAYRVRPSVSSPLPAYSCPKHRLLYYGVTRDDRLWAYAWVYQIGEMCLFSTILGHGDHMKAGIMPLLITQIVRDLMEQADLRYAMYNLHDSGTDGLRFFKEQLGFRPFDVTWYLGVPGISVGGDAITAQ